MKISFCVTVCNEREYIYGLLDQLSQFVKYDADSEIVVVQDGYDAEIREALLHFNAQWTGWGGSNKFRMYQHPLSNDFATHKNYATSKCLGDYIFQIDADELLSDGLFVNLRAILEANKNVDLFRVARVNTVTGLTEEHIKKWGWTVTEKGYVCWPDYQSRIYRNMPSIYWKNKVHEVITGAVTVANLPAEEDYALIHVKDIERQEKQNEFYNTI